MTNDPLTGNLDAMITRARSAFESRFGRPATLAAAAPGRVNLIGEHTDYNDGFVLPVAIDRWVVALADRASTRSESIVCSLDFEEEITLNLRRKIGRHDLAWANYPLGVAAMFREQGAKLPNLDLLFTSAVPVGSGLSSSAAIEVAFATLFEQAAGKTLDPVEKAMLCQKAEHEFPRAPCGIMDQMIAVLGRTDHALLLDCRTNEATLTPLPSADEAVLVIADTNVRHQLSDGGYGRRRRECERAVEFIRSHPAGEGVRSLRDVSPALLDSVAERMDETLRRRVRHVVTENARTRAAAEALRAGRLAEFGSLMFESHRSLRDDYEVSCDQLDALVELARELHESIAGRDRGVFGSRMTGGGFGGCTITLARPDAVAALTRRLVDGYRARFEISPTIFTTSAVGGARALES